MQKSVLLDIIASFDRKEHKYIQRWLQSPAHNKREDVALLFDLIINSGENLQKEKIYQLLYPRTKFDDARMRQVMYFLQKELEEYQIHQAVSDDLLFPSRTLLNVYQKKKLQKPFLRTLTKAKSALEKYPYRDRHYLQMQYLFLQEEYNNKSASGRFHDFDLQLLSDTSERYFLAEKLRLACIMQSHIRIYQSTYSQGLLDQLLTYVEEQQWLDFPAISLYYYSYRALTESDKVWFDRLLADMQKWKSHLPIEEEREVLFLALNFCIAKINEGDKSYYQQALDLYRTGIEEKTLLLHNGQISRYTFTNIIVAALHEKEYDWAEMLIKDYDHLIDITYRESAINLSYINLYYNRKEYKKAMRLISETIFDDVLMGLFAKGIMIKIYFETNQDSLLESYIDSFLTYLRRKDILQNYRTPYQFFAFSIKKIIRLIPGDKEAKEKLYQEILQIERIADREWLLTCLR